MELGHIEDLAVKAVKTGYAASRFLTPAEVLRITAHFSQRQDVTLTLDGSYENAERVRAIFTNPVWCAYTRDDLFAVLQISYRVKDSVGHRDILGAVTGTGIERDVIGDIILGKPLAALICLPELSRYIAENLAKIGRVGVNVSSITLDRLLRDFERWLEKLAPEKPYEQYDHNGYEDNADAHLKRSVMGREVIVAVTGGKLDFGTWEQIFYGEFDGMRDKRVLVKIIGE